MDKMLQQRQSPSDKGRCLRGSTVFLSSAPRPTWGTFNATTTTTTTLPVDSTRASSRRLNSPLLSVLTTLLLTLMLLAVEESSSSSWGLVVHAWTTTTSTTTSTRSTASLSPMAVVSRRRRHVFVPSHGPRALHLFGNDDNDDHTASDRRQWRPSRGAPTIPTLAAPADETKEPAVVGAEFFGGNKQKEEFYDAAAEAQAGEIRRKRTESSSTSTILNTESSTSSSTTATTSTTTTTTIPVAEPLNLEEAEEESSLVAPVEEEVDSLTKERGDFDRFSDTTAFESSWVADIARTLQYQINQVLYLDDDFEQPSVFAAASSSPLLAYASSLDWQSCFPVAGAKGAATPLTALSESLQFYRRLDVAVTAGKVLEDGRVTKQQQSSVVQLQWEVAVVWPILWDPRVVLTGQSVLHLSPRDSTLEITRQVDTLTGTASLESQIGRQLVPRFWDLYHVGMTPSAERAVDAGASPQKQLFSKCEIWDIPGRWVLRSSQLDDVEGREAATAHVLPVHAYAGYITTVGPRKQRYVPVTPLEVQLRATPAPSNLASTDATNTAMAQQEAQKRRPTLVWTVPLPVEMQSYTVWPNPWGAPDEANDSSSDETPNEEDLSATCRFEWQPARRVALWPCPVGTSPQDTAVQELRQQLYAAAVEKGSEKAAGTRPQFFYWNTACKACFTAEQGLGMAVYEWRPGFVASNYVGLELEV